MTIGDDAKLAISTAFILSLCGIMLLVGYLFGEATAGWREVAPPAFVSSRCFDLCMPNGGISTMEVNRRPRYQCTCENGALFSDKDLTR